MKLVFLIVPLAHFYFLSTFVLFRWNDSNTYWSCCELFVIVVRSWMLWKQVSRHVGRDSSHRVSCHHGWIPMTVSWKPSSELWCRFISRTFYIVHFILTFTTSLYFHKTFRDTYGKVEIKVNKLCRFLVRALSDDSIVQLIQECDECYCKVLSPLSDTARTLGQATKPLPLFLEKIRVIFYIFFLAFTNRRLILLVHLPSKTLLCYEYFLLGIKLYCKFQSVK